MTPSNFVGLASINLKHCHFLIYNDSLMSVAGCQVTSFSSVSVSSKCSRAFSEELYFAGTFDQRLVNAPHALALLAFQHLQAMAQVTTSTQRSARQVFHTVQLRRMAGAL
jgi:hypothetical protein